MSAQTNTVLAHLTVKLTSQRENAATEALAFVLNRSSAARAALTRHLASVSGAAMPSVSRVATQARVGDESRPDVLLLDDEGRTLGYIEAKFWAALTEAQPVAYLERLGEAGGGILVVLAPERRLHLLRLELEVRCREAKLQVQEWVARGGRVGANRIAMVSWRGLLAALEDALVDDRDSLSDVRQVRGLCERFETEGFIPLSREDIDDLRIPLLVRSLAGLTNEIVDAGVSSDDRLLDVKNLRSSNFSTAAGRYARLPHGHLWIGVSYDRWVQFGRTPMWAQVGYPGTSPAERHALRGWLTGESPRAYLEERENVLVPLELPTGVEKDAVIKAVLTQLRALDAAMAIGSPPAMPVNVPVG